MTTHCVGVAASKLSEPPVTTKLFAKLGPHFKANIEAAHGKQWSENCEKAHVDFILGLFKFRPSKILHLVSHAVKGIKMELVSVLFLQDLKTKH